MLSSRPFAPCLVIVVMSAVLGVTGPAFAQGGVTIYGVTTSDRLVRFDSANPCTVSNPIKIAGLQTNDLTTAFATLVGAASFTPPLQGSAFGVDFNPVVDLIRIVSYTGQNLRVSPVTGAVVGVDTSLAYAGGDINAGVPPTVAGAAYTNPDTNPATATTLYDIDVDLDVLTTQNPANSGALQTVGSLGLGTNDLLAFDIAVLNMMNVGYAAMKLAGHGLGRQCGNSTLVQIDLGTGVATPLDAIGTQQPITGLAVFIPPPGM